MALFPLSSTARRFMLTGGILLIACAAVPGSAAAATAGDPPRVPAASAHPAGLPHPVPVTVNPRTTAYLVLDLTSVVCAPNPSCTASLPAAAALLARARAAGATVVYSQTPTPGSKILPPVAPEPGEPAVKAHADKFFGTDLGQILSSRGIKTLVIVGSVTNGAVLYTAFDANERGYTVVVAEDGVSADSPFIMRYSLFQLLNEPGYTNPQNTSLKADAVTLSRARLVRFRASG